MKMKNKGVSHLTRRPKSTQARIDNFFDLPVKAIFHPDFENPMQIKKFTGEFPNLAEFNLKRKEIEQLAVRELNPIIRLTYKEPLLDKDQEIYLAKRLNYYKYLAEELRKKEVRETPNWKKINLFEKYLKLALEAQNQMVLSNLRLGVNIAKKFKTSSLTIEELIDESYYGVLSAVNKFDISLGWRFSTFCNWVVYNYISSACRKENRALARCVPTEFKEEDISVDDIEIIEKQLLLKQVLHVMEKIQDNIKDEREILALRHHIGIGFEPKTLQECGKVMNITKERVRQLEEKAILRIQRELKNESLSA